MKGLKALALVVFVLTLTLCATAQAATRTVSLSWNAASGATGYNVYRGTTSGGPYTKLNTTTLTNTTYTDTATTGAAYYYVVTSVAAACPPSQTSPGTPNTTTPCGESVFSGEIVVGVAPKPNVTSVISATVP